MGSKVIGRFLSRVTPTAEVLQLQILPFLHRRCVRFDMDAITVHEIPAYGEIYGAHPRTFVFDGQSRRLPAAPNGFVSLEAVMGEDQDDEDFGDASSDEDVVMYGRGALIDLQNSEAEV